jgi:hypothetical protein
MVVVDSGFVARDRTRRLEPPQETHLGQGVQYVVHGLPGHSGQGDTDDTEDSFRVGVRACLDRPEDADPRTGYAQISLA